MAAPVCADVCAAIPDDCDTTNDTNGSNGGKSFSPTPFIIVLPSLFTALRYLCPLFTSIVKPQSNLFSPLFFDDGKYDMNSGRSFIQFTQCHIMVYTYSVRARFHINSLKRSESWRKPVIIGTTSLMRNPSHARYSGTRKLR